MFVKCLFLVFLAIYSNHEALLLVPENNQFLSIVAILRFGQITYLEFWSTNTASTFLKMFIIIFVSNIDDVDVEINPKVGPRLFLLIEILGTALSANV